MNGINNGIQQTAKQPALLAALAAVNPAVLAVGVVGVAVFALFTSGKKDKKKSPPAVEKASVQQLSNGSVTVQQTVNNGKTDSSDPYESMSEEELQKELIRQAMSELGKRSAAARARKKLG